ncbi:hypothetical protein BC828DRAFT_403346 [Blastocladiella britannica]|nr:hypothetical protein BC828DRAFT_403346 [Blastocladiella britannica]
MPESRSTALEFVCALHPTVPPSAPSAPLLDDTTLAALAVLFDARRDILEKALLLLDHARIVLVVENNASTDCLVSPPTHGYALMYGSADAGFASASPGSRMVVESLDDLTALDLVFPWTQQQQQQNHRQWSEYRAVCRLDGRHCSCVTFEQRVLLRRDLGICHHILAAHLARLTETAAIVSLPAACYAEFCYRWLLAGKE